MTFPHALLDRACRLLVGCCLLTCVGCLGSGSIGFPLAARTPREDAFRIEYSLAAVGEVGPSGTFHEAALLPANWLDEPAAAATQLDGHSAELKIEYPHPQKGNEVALATLKVYEPSDLDHAVASEGRTAPLRRWVKRWNPLHHADSDDRTLTLPKEIVTLEISRTQFELLMSDLHRETYVAESTKKFLPEPHGDVSLSILHNRQLLHRSSIAEPRLDEFLRRVYRDGDVLLGQREPRLSIVATSAEVAAPEPDHY